MRPEVQAVIDAAFLLDAALDPIARKAELAEKMKPFDAEWKYAPQSEKTKANHTIVTEQQARIAERAVEVLRAADLAEPLIRADIAEAENAPDDLADILTKHGAVGATLAEVLLVDVRTELQLARFSRELRGAPGVDLLARYPAAKAAGAWAEVRFIEEHGAALVRPSADPEQITAGHLLTRAIAETRAARVPPELREAEALIRKGRAAVDRTEDLKHEPSIPAGV